MTPKKMTVTQKLSFLAEVVLTARKFVGQKEDPPGSNWGPFVKKVLAGVGIHTPASWCAAFVCFVFDQCGSLGTLTRSGYVPDLVNHARKLGLAIASADALTGKATVRPGYVMCQWHPELTGYHHTGIVETVGADGAFVSIEGNTNDTGGREGQAVLRQHRSMHDVCSDGHVKYCFIQTI